jgi:acyl-CoA thioester hydrolase
MNGDPLMLMKVVNPDLADYPVRSIEKLRYADTDRQGHISNAVFVVCCQNARMVLLCDQERVPRPPNTEFVTVKLVLEYRAEMHWPGKVEIGTRVTRIGSSSVVLAQVLYVDQACVALADTTVVLMDGTARRSTPLPPQTVHALKGLVTPYQGRVRTVAPLSLRAPALRAVAKRAMKLARLRGLGQSAKPKPLISQGSNFKGLHYRAGSGSGADAVIFGAADAPCRR